MSRLFTDGAEWGDMLFWNTPGALNTASVVQARSGVYSYRFAGSTASKLFTDSAEVFVRTGFYAAFSGSQTVDMIQLYDDSDIIAAFRYYSIDGRIEYRSGVSSMAFSTIAVPPSQWGRVEFRLKISDTVGAASVLLDGVEILTFAGDTKPGAGTTVNTMRAGSGSSATVVYYLDDLALNNTTGAADNSWCGDGKVYLLKPNADGDTTQWTNSAGTAVNNWDYVNNLPPGATYIENGTAGQTNFMNLETHDITNETVLRVGFDGRGLDTVGGADVKLDVKTLGTVYQSGNVTLTVNSARIVGPDYTVNPSTLAAWTQAQLDAIQISPETV